MKPREGYLTKEQLHVALNALNTKLKAEDIRLTFYCIGGSAMMSAYDARTSTQDLDGSLSPVDPDTVRRFEALKTEVAQERSIPEQWINLQAAGIVRDQGFRQKDFVPKAGYFWSNLQLMFAKPECLLAMKCQALRTRSTEWQDTAFLLRHLKIRSMNLIREAVAQYFDLSNLETTRGHR